MVQNILWLVLLTLEALKRASAELPTGPARPSLIFHRPRWARLEIPNRVRNKDA